MLLNKLKALVVEEEGQGMTEYALILGVIAIGVVAVLVTFGEAIEEHITGLTETFFGE